MTGPEHYVEAERLLASAQASEFMQHPYTEFAKAHAVLALAAATALNDAEKGFTVADWTDWLETAGTE
jgi:hypothetical protein